MVREVTTTGREQRKNWRYACNANVSLYNVLNQRRIPGIIVDLSVSGCLVRPDEPGLQAGDILEVSFSLHGFSIRVGATVRNVRPDNSIGIEFRGRNDNSSWQISKLIERLAEEWMRSQNRQTPR